MIVICNISTHVGWGNQCCGSESVKILDFFHDLDMNPEQYILDPDPAAHPTKGSYPSQNYLRKVFSTINN